MSKTAHEELFSREIRQRLNPSLFRIFKMLLNILSNKIKLNQL